MKNEDDCDIEKNGKCHEKFEANKQKFNHGRWEKEEHEKFIEAINKYGKNWNKIEKYISTRSSAQARSHAQKYFNKIQVTTENNPFNKDSIYSFQYSILHKERNIGKNDCLLKNKFDIELNQLKKKKQSISSNQTKLGECTNYNSNVFKIIEPIIQNDDRIFYDENNTNTLENIKENDNNFINLKFGEKWESRNIDEIYCMFDDIFQN